jgi:hypothetical protein
MGDRVRDSDDLGVLSSTGWVVEQARAVTVDEAAVEAVADSLAHRPVPVPEWDSERHLVDGTARTAQFVLVLDALNFCFWGEPRWEVEYRGQWVNGYWALAVSLKRAVVEGVPVLDAGYLASLEVDGLRHILRGRGVVPLLDERLANLREVGARLLATYSGEFVNAIALADHSATALVRLLVGDFPSFDDRATYRGREVRFYKRAQILVGDLAGSFGGRGWGRFDDLGALTAFADYKVPQVLRRLGILAYAPALARRVDAEDAIAAGSEEEVEIRAATVWAVERLRLALARRGTSLTAMQVDWYLWDLGQTRAPDERPYHRTRTIYY